MLCIRSPVVIVILLIVSAADKKNTFPRALLNSKIDVAFPNRPVTVILDRSETFTSLGTLIIDNFIRRFGLTVDYLIANASLCYVFAEKNNLDSSENGLSLRYGENPNAFSDMSILRYKEIFQIKMVIF